jgi:ribokinase
LIPAFAVHSVDSTGAGDAFAAGLVYGLASSWDWDYIGRFASAAGALATRDFGAQASLPTFQEVANLMAL